jgi:hypothetical protein
LTGPELTAIPGLFPASHAGIARSLGWDSSSILEPFGELYARGMAKADWRSGLVWLPNAVRDNVPESPRRVRGWRRIWEALPVCDLKYEAFARILSECSSVGPAFGQAFRDHPATPKTRTSDASTRRLRPLVIVRDGHVCRLCGGPVDPDGIDIDHIVPYSKGGPTILENLRVTHSGCNRSRGNRMDWRPS